MQLISMVPVLVAYDGYFEWGVYTNDKISAMNISTKGMNIYGKYIGSAILEPGDLVCIAGGYEEDVLCEGDKPIIYVDKVKANNTEQVIGVVEYRTVVREEEVHQGTDSKISKSFRHADGNISTGDYLSIVVYGPASVKNQSGMEILPGEKIIAGANGIRPAKKSEVNGIILSENVGLIGKSLERNNGDMLKVFVNCK